MLSHKELNVLMEETLKAEWKIVKYIVYRKVMKSIMK